MHTFAVLLSIFLRECAFAEDTSSQAASSVKLTSPSVMYHLDEARHRLQSMSDCHKRVNSIWNAQEDSCNHECTKLKLALTLANCILEKQSQRQIWCMVEMKECKLIPAGCLSRYRKTTKWSHSDTGSSVGIWGGGGEEEEYDDAVNELVTHQGIVMTTSYAHIDSMCVQHAQLRLQESSLNVQKLTRDSAVASLEKLESSARQIEMNTVLLERNLGTTEQAVRLGRAHIETLESTDLYLQHALSELTQNLELTRSVSKMATMNMELLSEAHKKHDTSNAMLTKNLDLVHESAAVGRETNAVVQQNRAELEYAKLRLEESVALAHESVSLERTSLQISNELNTRIKDASSAADGLYKTLKFIIHCFLFCIFSTALVILLGSLSTMIVWMDRTLAWWRQALGTCKRHLIQRCRFQRNFREESTEYPISLSPSDQQPPPVSNLIMRVGNTALDKSNHLEYHTCRCIECYESCSRNAREVNVSINVCIVTLFKIFRSSHHRTILIILEKNFTFIQNPDKSIHRSEWSYAECSMTRARKGKCSL